MSIIKPLLAILAGVLALMLWHGLAQLFPWGVPTVHNFSATSDAPYVASTTGLRAAPAGAWTTEAFDEQFTDQISTLATDRSFSWIISIPRDRYSLPAYFTRHALTQAFAAIAILISLRALAPLSRPRRIGAVACLGLMAAVAIYAEMLNWMGAPPAYALGQAFNQLAGWTLASLAIDRLARTGPAPSPAQPAPLA